MIRRNLCWTLGLVWLLLASPAFAQDSVKLALGPVELAAPVLPAEAEVYYQTLSQACLARKQDIRVIERRQLGLVRDELDLSASLGSENAARAYAAAGKAMQANRVLVPAICKIDADFLLSLRMVTVSEGTTRCFALRKTRLTEKFAALAAALADEVINEVAGAGPADPPPKDPSTPVKVDPPAKADPVKADPAELPVTTRQLQEACKRVSAPEYFPALWTRAESIAAEGPGKGLCPAYYYDTLLHLSARAAHAPEGMKFIPGGHVFVPTSAGPRKIWVEPFFIDLCEASVEEYLKFQAALQEHNDAQALRECRSITIAHAMFKDPAGPVTGISHAAAERYAAWRGRQLPTMLQWLRAAYGDQEQRPLPCGEPAQAAGCNLAGAQDGFAILAPAARPGQDVSCCGVLGMTGNVREWTRTWHDLNAYARTAAADPREPEQGTMRVVLGGSWRTAAGQADRTFIDKARPGECADDLGFRCVIPFFTPVAE